MDIGRRNSLPSGFRTQQRRQQRRQQQQQQQQQHKEPCRKHHHDHTQQPLVEEDHLEPKTPSPEEQQQEQQDHHNHSHESQIIHIHSQRNSRAKRAEARKATDTSFLNSNDEHKNNYDNNHHDDDHQTSHSSHSSPQSIKDFSEDKKGIAKSNAKVKMVNVKTVEPPPPVMGTQQEPDLVRKTSSTRRKAIHTATLASPWLEPPPPQRQGMGLATGAEVLQVTRTNSNSRAKRAQARKQGLGQNDPDLDHDLNHDLDLNHDKEADLYPGRISLCDLIHRFDDRDDDSSCGCSAMVKVNPSRNALVQPLAFPASKAPSPIQTSSKDSSLKVPSYQGQMAHYIKWIECEDKELGANTIANMQLGKRIFRSASCPKSQRDKHVHFSIL